MPAYLALVLHAHLPFVRHPEHPRFLEESWLYEAITETYLPLLDLLERWQQERRNLRLTLSISPTLCAMLLDPLLQARYEERLERLVQLAEQEVVRTHFDPRFHRLAEGHLAHVRHLRQRWHRWNRDLVGAFRHLQDAGRLELITCAATHAVLPLLVEHPSAIRGQVLTARDYHRACFGRDPVGFWLPECGYHPDLDLTLQEANLRWVILDSHGLLRATPRPRYGTFAPVFTPEGIAAFGRDFESAEQVWSRESGYPGDPHYRDFYRDLGFDVDLDYLEPYLPAPGVRGFTGIKYWAITGREGAKQVYDPVAAAQVVDQHARHFLAARMAQLTRAHAIMDRAPIVVAPYDAELFGHWWHEGLAFLDALARLSPDLAPDLEWITPTDYLRRHATHQVVRPVASTWGEGGHLQVWLNERNEWIQPRLRHARDRLIAFTRRHRQPSAMIRRALQQTARELLLAEASDWPFILHHGANPSYARARIETHLAHLLQLDRQLQGNRVDATGLAELESRNHLFPRVDPWLWAAPSERF